MVKSMAYYIIHHHFFLQYFHSQSIQERICWNWDLWELGPKMVKVQRFQSNNYKVGFFLFKLKFGLRRKTSGK